MCMWQIKFDLIWSFPYILTLVIPLHSHTTLVIPLHSHTGHSSIFSHRSFPYISLVLSSHSFQNGCQVGGWWIGPRRISFFSPDVPEDFLKKRWALSYKPRNSKCTPFRNSTAFFPATSLVGRRMCSAVEGPVFMRALNEHVFGCSPVSVPGLHVTV